MTREEKNAYQREWNKKNRDKKREQDRKYREANREKINEIHKKWRDKNKEHVKEKAKENYKKNPEAHKIRVQRYRAKNKEKIDEAHKKYREENREKRTMYETQKRHSDPIYKFRSSFTSLIRHYLKKTGYAGNKTVWEVVDMDFASFRTYIESQFEEGMSWENYGHRNGCWNIDHIIPICSAKTEADSLKLNHYSNLRPMWATENYKKSKKIL